MICYRIFNLELNVLENCKNLNRGNDICREQETDSRLDIACSLFSHDHYMLVFDSAQLAEIMQVIFYGTDFSFFYPVLYISFSSLFFLCWELNLELTEIFVVS